jgi:hypothetical protein
MKKLPDIDIDFLNRDAALAHLDHKVASIDRNGTRVKHNTGVYVQNIPTDHTNLATIDYELAEELGYFKLDLLNNSAYQGIDTLDLRDYLSRKEPNWDLLHEKEICEMLPHCNGYSNVFKQMNPQNIEELAMCLAMIRPGKKHLIGKSWQEINQTIWQKPLNGEYYWKKSHAIAYSILVVMRLNYLEYQASLNK